MKLSSCYLEHLDSLGLRHAKWLKSWVGGYIVWHRPLNWRSDVVTWIRKCRCGSTIDLKIMALLIRATAFRQVQIAATQENADKSHNKQQYCYWSTVDPRVTTGLTYDQSFCFDLRPNVELRPAPAPAWRAHIRYHVHFTASARSVCFVLQARPC
jgi:hypothetical protein